MTKTIISLTTIPTRLSQIGPVLESLVAQLADIEAIILWVPETYRRREFGDFIVIPAMPDGVEVRRCAIDYGPATKILPSLKAFHGQDVRIIYCDDDRIYLPNWAQNLIAASETYPDHCITEAGEVVAATLQRALRNDFRYRMKSTLSLGVTGAKYRKQLRAMAVDFGLVDIAKGYGGILVRPDFFNEAVFEIPDVLWTVDDIWLSGQMAVNGTRIYKAAAKENSRKTENAEKDALFDLVYEGHDRKQANLACIRYFQKNHGIWLP